MSNTEFNKNKEKTIPTKKQFRILFVFKIKKPKIAIINSFCKPVSASLQTFGRRNQSLSTSDYQSNH
jgi:hypothetical protein